MSLNNVDVCCVRAAAVMIAVLTADVAFAQDGPIIYRWRGAPTADGNPVSGPHTGSGSASNKEHLQGRREITTIDPEQGIFEFEYFPIQAGDSASFQEMFVFRPQNIERTVALGGLPSLDHVDFNMKWAAFGGGMIDANSIDIYNLVFQSQWNAHRRNPI